MKRYESKNHPGVFATVTDINEKYKTAMLDFDDGKSQSVSVVTLRNQWTLVDDNYNPHAEESDKNASTIIVKTADDVPSRSDEPTPDIESVEIPPEPPVVVKPKKVRKSTAKIPFVSADVIDTFRDKLEAILENEFGLTKLNYTMDNVTLFRSGKKTILKLYYGKRMLVFHVKPKIVPNGIKYKTHKYFLSAVIHKDYDDNTISLIKSLMSNYKTTN